MSADGRDEAASGGAPDGSMSEDRVTLLDIVELLVRRSRFIFKAVLIAGVATAIVSLITPAWYRSRASIFGPEEISENRRMFSTLRSLSIPGVRQNITAQSPETFLAILESRRLREKIIERFGLMKAYRSKNIEDCLKKLGKHASAEIENTGVIGVVVEDRDRERAAGIANAMIEELDKVNVEVRIYKARRARQHLEIQVQETRARLEVAEDSLSRFQTENLAISIDEQAKAAVTTAAELEAKIIELRIRKGLLESYAAESNPELRATARELEVIETQIGTLESGPGEEFALARLPEMARRLGSLMREVKVGEALLALLIQDFQEARLDEAKETPVVQVLDVAVPAARRFTPRRTTMVLSAMGGALLLALIYVIAAERYRKFGSPADRDRWAALASSLVRALRIRSRDSGV